MLNTETASEMKTKHGGLLSCLYFGVIQNHISKTNIFGQLLSKVEEKVCLMLCIIEARKATDRVSNEFIKMKAEQKLLRLYTEKNSPWLSIHVVKPVKWDWDHVLFDLYLPFYEQMFALSRLFESYNLNYSF